MRQRIRAAIAQATEGQRFAAEISAAADAVADALGVSMFGLAGIDAPMTERVPAQALALRLIREAVTQVEEDFNAAMAKVLGARS
ncbi:MAG: hypothetical protein LC640_08975 [Frankia sp.]|nr:hypothetical protein [Frankia sp.]